MKKIGLLNGPNLDRLGKREPEVYGSVTLEEIVKQVESKAETCDCKVEAFQSNHEGALIDKIHQWADSGFSGLILNPGGLTHTSVALRDAVVASGLKTVEVHLSNIHAREDFRHKSLISAISAAVVAGMSQQGYISALRFLSEET
ncbi:MAG TPA: type II 3-dehydroquinate dehydratase [Opitutae bacterium]|nr:type II 3-dehydroquinate dehydratase [Opitutae bacterium]HCY57255.1 type II 3-dehydroquinate dehydratase [Opitutae bacterium]|tara:strand:- start:13 stop:447 length:435 start_codon:yes stop_codon:yes gene_type:complete